MATSTLVSWVNSFVEDYCNQKFTTTVVTEDVDGGSDNLVLKYNNIASVTSVTDRADSEVISSTSYDVDTEAGIIRYKDWATSNIDLLGGMFEKGKKRYRVVYTTGYSDQPNSVKLAAAEIVAMVEKSDPSLVSESIGEYSYSKISAMLPPETRAKLMKYKNVGMRF